MYITTSQLNLIYGLLIIALFSPLMANAQKVQLEVITPGQNAVISGQNLFVSVKVDSQYKFSGVNTVQVFLDDNLLKGITKVKNNTMNFVYPHKIKTGKHKIRVVSRFAGINNLQGGTWTFYAGKKDGIKASTVNKSEKDNLKIRGSISMDYRTEQLSGPGVALRQEPLNTQNLNVDLTAAYKGVEIPVRIFATNNNIYSTQSMNFFQAGFKTRWMELSAGDLNPSFDRLVVGGVRLRGIGLKLKSHLSTIQVYYGDMTSPVNGSLQVYSAGLGILPTNMADSTHYIVSGTYRRTLIAARAELGSVRDELKLCFTGAKVKDDTSSIRYGLAPKDNLALGTDLTLKLFHKSVIINAGIAASIITNDISTGPISKKTLDTSFKVNTSFDPVDYQSLIILNASTLPARPSSYIENLASYTQLNYGNKYQVFMVEYKNTGSLYNSLANPFMPRDYEGVTANEKIYLFKRKISMGGGYQNYNNNLSGINYMKIHTEGYNGSLFLNPGKNWPNISVNYLKQSRTGYSSIIDMQGINDQITNYNANLNYTLKTLGLQHRLRLNYNYSNRADLFNSQNKFSSTNVMAGISENIGKRLNINADLGKATITGTAGTLSDMVLYNIGLDFEIIQKHLHTSLYLSNNKTTMSVFTNETYRQSIIAKASFRFLKGMGIDIEGGYQPYIDVTNSNNNYNEIYGYIRYSCDLGSIFK